jgi:hypothetical protein
MTTIFDKAATDHLRKWADHYLYEDEREEKINVIIKYLEPLDPIDLKYNIENLTWREILNRAESC